jgi:hypothetical protein
MALILFFTDTRAHPAHARISINRVCRDARGSGVSRKLGDSKSEHRPSSKIAFCLARSAGHSLRFQAVMIRIAALLFIAFLAACSRPSLAGIYQTRGSVDKFRITLELRPDGKAVFATHSNLGNAQIDQTTQTLLTIPNGRWNAEQGQVILQGARGDGKTVTERFALQENGDLIWTQNGARFVRTR